MNKTTVIHVAFDLDLIQRFFAKVEPTEDCWLWRGRVNPMGSGQMRIRKKSRGAQPTPRTELAMARQAAPAASRSGKHAADAHQAAEEGSNPLDGLTLRNYHSVKL